MALLLEAVTFDVADVAAVARFWAGLLERAVLTESGGVFLPGGDRQVGLRFVASQAEPVGRPRLHLNELCVIQPGNNYLAGTGYLGEVTCDGSRDVGLFWRDALGWPLVWDLNEQTAIQSPRGGAKIAWDSWGWQRGELENARNRQRLDLVAADVAGEAQRLVSLGATRLWGRRPDSVGLADPDGNEFRLRCSV